MNKLLIGWTPALILVIAGTTQSIAAGPFGATLELSSLNGPNGFVCNGINASDFSGSSVASAGDINGDGIDDLIIGARLADPNGVDSGESYVIFGGASVGASGTIELSALTGADGFVINGVNPGDQSGVSVASAGDINGDNVGDLIIGANIAEPNGLRSGQTYVVFGGVGIGAGGTLELSTLTGTNGFVLNGININDQSGFTVASAGDINNDGDDDLIIGASGSDPNGIDSGACYIVFGGPGVGASGTIEFSSLNGTNGFTCNGAVAFDRTGASVSPLGDINNDNVDDVIICGFTADPNGIDSGESYVIFGSASVGSSGTIALSALNGTDGFVCNGVGAGDYSGYSVSSAGDINGDGVSDLLIGAKFADPNGSNSGESYVVFGSAGIGAGGSLNLSALNGADGFVLNGVDGNDRSGFSVSGAGDINGDGVDDLIISGYLGDTNGVDSGESYVVFGGVGIGATGSLELSALSGVDGFVCNGVNAGDQSGRSVSSAGDVNGDSIDDVVIGARSADPNGSGSGASYVVFGRIDCPGDLNLDGVIDTADLGILLGQFGTAGPGADINNDGVVDTADLGILLGSFGIACP